MLQEAFATTRSQPDYDGIVPMRDGVRMAADICFPSGYDFPEGFDMNITDAIIRARIRDSFESPWLMKSGGQDQFAVVLYPTSDVFAKGQGLRADISRSYFQGWMSIPILANRSV